MNSCHTPDRVVFTAINNAITTPIRGMLSNPFDGPRFLCSVDLTRPTARGALGGLQHQDPIWISVAVITRSCEVLSAGVAEWPACDYREGVIAGIEPTGVRETSHLRHIDCDRRGNGAKGQYSDPSGTRAAAT